MPITAARLSALIYLLFAGILVATAAGSHNHVTLAITVASVAMFASCWASAIHLLGSRAALRFVAIALCLGWFAEQMGASRGWFFGSYHYTDVLGVRLADVPVVIPLMWFSLTYTGYVIANLIVWQTPARQNLGVGQAAYMSLIAALVVTAFDLGADPYLIRVVGAWTMEKTTGYWFGETLQGFAGWVLVSFCIVSAFRLATRRMALAPTNGYRRRDALTPLAIYGTGMVFQMALGDPPETRAIAPFAMGIPLLCALAGLQRWTPAPSGVAA
jgi:putative membrane protein